MDLISGLAKYLGVKTVDLTKPKETHINDDDDVTYSTDIKDYVVGATVRQWHHINMFDDAVITSVHSNGGLDVVRKDDGERNRWSVKCCAVVKKTEMSQV